MNETDNRTLSLTRTFDAPIQLVWEAWTQPGHIAQWWGPKGMETKVVQHNFEVGGAWEYVTTMPGGNEFVSEGVYLSIVELKQIFTTANMRPMTEGVEIRAFFEAAAEQTKFVFQVIHPTEEYCQQQDQMGFQKGWGSVFNRLEEHLGAK